MVYWSIWFFLTDPTPLVYYILNALLYCNPTVSLSYSIFINSFFSLFCPAVFAATLSPQPSPHNTHNSDTTEYLKLYKPLVSWIWQEGWVCCPYTKSSGEIPTKHHPIYPRVQRTAWAAKEKKKSSSCGFLSYPVQRESFLQGFCSACLVSAQCW